MAMSATMQREAADDRRARPPS